MGRITLRASRWEDLAGKASKCGYLDAPVPKEKPPPVPVPPAATVVEPSVPVPKENPVDMAAPAQRLPNAGRGPGCSSRIRAEAGRGALLPASAWTWRESQTPAAAKTRPRRAEPPRRRTSQRPPRARSPPEVSAPRRELWDRVGPACGAKHPGTGVGSPPTLLEVGSQSTDKTSFPFSSIWATTLTLSAFQRCCLAINAYALAYLLKGCAESQSWEGPSGHFSSRLTGKKVSLVFRFLAPFEKRGDVCFLTVWQSINNNSLTKKKKKSLISSTT